jgi:hypothetical protein
VNPVGKLMPLENEAARGPLESAGTAGDRGVVIRRTTDN